MTFIVIADLFTPAERGRYQGLVGAVFGIASVLGPLIGGLLTDHAGGWIPGVEGWRWVFYVNLPVGAVAVGYIVRRMPRLDPPGERRPPISLSGLLLLAGLIPLIVSLQLDKRRPPLDAGSGRDDIRRSRRLAHPAHLRGRLRRARGIRATQPPICQPDPGTSDSSATMSSGRGTSRPSSSGRPSCP